MKYLLAAGAGALGLYLYWRYTGAGYGMAATSATAPCGCSCGDQTHQSGSMTPAAQLATDFGGIITAGLAYGGAAPPSAQSPNGVPTSGSLSMLSGQAVAVTNAPQPVQPPPAAYGAGPTILGGVIVPGQPSAASMP